MKFFFMDYSGFYYPQILNKPLPRLRSGKFIQVLHNKSEYFVCSPSDFSLYHANIAERFFSQKEVQGTYNLKKDLFQVTVPEWEIIGGGRWEIDETEKQLLLSGKSLAYGAFEREGLREKLENVDCLAGFRIQIE